MPEESQLIDFQDALLELLASGQPQNVILDTLKTDPRFEPYQEYVKGFDPDMVAVACELMGKWAKRKDSKGEQNL
jgi:hypothetical protein